MRPKEFRDWLSSTGFAYKPISDCISRCKKVESTLRLDLDEEYLKDKGEAVLESMKYSINDEKNNKKAPKGFKFKSGVKIRLRLMDLRSATKKYFTFCEKKNT